MVDYRYRVENWSNGKYVVIRDDSGHQVTRYRYDWGIAPEDNYIQANNIIEELQEADREKAIREEEEKGTFNVAHVDNWKRSANRLNRRYQYIIRYNRDQWFSIMTNKQFSDEELYNKIEKIVTKHYNRYLDSIDYIELVESS